MPLQKLQELPKKIIDKFGILYDSKNFSQIEKLTQRKKRKKPEF